MPTITTEQLQERIKQSQMKSKRTISTEELFGANDVVFGREMPKADFGRLERLRPVLEGTAQIEDLMEPDAAKHFKTSMDQMADPAAFRKAYIAQTLLSDSLKIKDSQRPLVRQHFDTFVKKSFGTRISDDEVIRRLNPYSVMPVMTAAPEPGFFSKAWNGLKDKTLGPVSEYYYDGERIRPKRSRGPIKRFAFGADSLKSKDEFARKSTKESLQHGFSQAGVNMVKSAAGTAQAYAELDADQKTHRNKALKQIRDKKAESTGLKRIGLSALEKIGETVGDVSDSLDENLSEWGTMMAAGVDEYYNEHPEEAIQLQPGTGVVGTTWQYISRPELIVQGTAETTPLILSMVGGGIVGGSGGQIVTMAGQTFGNNYLEARESGRDPETAVIQSLLQSTGEALIEKVSFDQKVKVFKSAAGQTAKKGLAKAAASMALDKGKQIVGGGKNAYIRGFAEESSQAMNQNFWSMVFSAQPMNDNFMSQLTDGAWEAGASGGVIEVGMSGGFAAAGNAVSLAQKGKGFVTDADKVKRIVNLQNFVKKNPDLADEVKTEIDEVFEKKKTDILKGKYGRVDGPATQAFRKQVQQSFGIDEKRAAAAMALVDARAEKLGMTTEEFVETKIAGVQQSELDDDGMPTGKQGVFFQDADDLVVYHGTIDVTKEFSPSENGDLGNGLYFTRNEDMAKNFANMAFRSSTVEAKGDGTFVDINSGGIIEAPNAGIKEADISQLKIKQITPQEYISEVENLRAPKTKVLPVGYNTLAQNKFKQEGYDGIEITGTKESDQILVFPESIDKLDHTAGSDIFFQSYSDTYRRKLLREFRADVTNHPIYQMHADGIKDWAGTFLQNLGRKLDFGDNLGDVKQYIDGVSGKGYLWKYISTEPGQGQAWDDYAKELSEYTHTEITDPTAFIEALDAAVMASKEKSGVIVEAMQKAKDSGDVSFLVAAEKYELAQSGTPVDEINQKVRDLAENHGISADEIEAETVLTEIESAREDTQKRRKAAVEFLADGRAVLHAFESADFSSLVHEIAHVFRRTLDEDQLQRAEQWAGVKDGQWTRSAEEKFARGMERYLYEGRAPNIHLQAVFAQLRQWLREIYERLRGSAIDVTIQPQIQEVFDSLFAVPEIHPGEMTFEQFFDKMGNELVNADSQWIRRYALKTAETPNQMHRRLKREWKAMKDQDLLAGGGGDAGDDSSLTSNQKRSIDRIEKSTKTTDQEILAAEKSLKIEQLLEHNQTDQRLVAAVKQELKAAYAAGKKKGIDRAKGHYKEVLSKVRARRELREHIKLLAKRIAKPASATVDLYYREAIAALQAGLDPSFRQTKTLEDRQRIRKFLEKYPNTDMPYRVRKAIEKRALNEYTIAELEELAGEVARLRKQGRLKRELRLEQRRRRLNEITDEIVNNLTNGEIIVESDPVAASTSKKPIVKTAWKAARAATLRPARIFDLLDGAKGTFDGTAHGAFYDAVNQGWDAKLRMTDSRIEAGNEKLAELGLTLEELADKRVIDGVEYSVNEMLGIYGYSLNDKSQLAVMFGNRISSRAMDSIRHHVENEDPRLAELVRWIIGEFDHHFERLENAFIEVEEKRLVKELNYLPMRRQELDYTPDARQILNEMLERATFKKAYAEKGFTIKRSDIPAEFQKPIRLDLWSMWAEQVNTQEHFIHLAELTRDLHRIVNNDRFRDAVRNKLGDEYLKEIRDYVSRVANPNIYKGYGYFERISRILRKNAAISYLAFNLVTMVKQLPSAVFYLADAGPGHLIASAAEFAKNPKAMIQRVGEMDPQVKHAALERTLEELKQHDRKTYEGIINRVGEAGMKGIYMMDAVARSIGWNAVYHRARADGESKDESIRQAQNATLRTQPAASAKDIAAIYTKNETLNWFLMFSNQLSNLYNITTYDIPTAWKNKQFQRAALGMVGVSISAMVMWSIANKRLPEEPEEVAEVFEDQFLSIMPLIGNPALSEKRGWGGGGIGILDSIAKVGISGLDIISGEGEDDDIKQILEETAVYLGIPTVATKRVYKAIENEDAMELIGGQPR